MAEQLTPPVRRIVVDSLRSPDGPGESFLVMVDRVVRSAVRCMNVPPPDPPGVWDDDSLAEVAADFVTAKWPRVLDAGLNAAADAEFAAWLRKSFRRFLADRSRETLSGKLRRRIQHLLGEDDRFGWVPPDSWALKGTAAGPHWGASQRALTDAAWRTETTSYSWWSASGDHAPFGDRQDILAVTAAILVAAGGPVPVDVLAEVIAQRLNLPTAWRFDYVDTHDAQLGAEDLSEEDRDAARWLVSQLTVRERDILSLVAEGATVRAAAARLGIPKSTLNVLQGRSERRAAALALVHPDPDRVVRAAATILADAGQVAEPARSNKAQDGDHEQR